MNLSKFICILILSESLCFAQTKSYEDRLSQIANQKSDQSLGTISGQNKEEMRHKELYEAYSYTQRESKINPSFDAKDYVEFRKKNNISEYVGDEVVKGLIQSSKEEAVKTEAVKLLESEKLLYESYQAYSESKNKTKDESAKKDAEDRINIIAKQSSTLLSSSLQKLSDMKALTVNQEARDVQYMASGGRVFPTLDLEQDKDFLNLKGSMLERVQKELLQVMARAINQHYHKEQGDTAKEEITSKAQLMAFVKSDEGSADMQHRLQDERKMNPGHEGESVNRADFFRSGTYNSGKMHDAVLGGAFGKESQEMAKKNQAMWQSVQDGYKAALRGDYGSQSQADAKAMTHAPVGPMSPAEARAAWESAYRGDMGEQAQRDAERNIREGDVPPPVPPNP